MLAGFASQILLARYLGPQGKGVVDLFLLIPTVLASVLEFGLLSANTYYAGKGTIPIDTLHSNSVVWSMGLGVLVVILGMAAYELNLDIFHSLPGRVLFFSLASLLPSLYFSLWSGLMYGSDSARAVYFVSAIATVAALVLYAIGMIFKAGVETLVVLTCLSLYGRAAVCFQLVRRRSSVLARPSFVALRQALSYGVALYIGIAIATLHLRIGQILIERHLGAAQLGLFALSSRIAELVWLLDYVVQSAILYRITSASRSDAVLLSQRASQLVLILVMVPSVVIFVTAPYVVPLVFGEPFRPSVQPLSLMLPGIIFFSLGRSLTPFIAYQCGKPWYNTLAAAVAFVVNVLCNTLLIPRFGINGAGVALSLSSFTNFLLVALTFRYLSGGSLLKTFVPSPHDLKLVIAYAREQFSEYFQKNK